MINARVEVNKMYYRIMDQLGDLLEEESGGNCWRVPTSGEHSGFSIWS